MLNTHLISHSKYIRSNGWPKEWERREILPEKTQCVHLSVNKIHNVIYNSSAIGYTIYILAARSLGRSLALYSAVMVENKSTYDQHINYPNQFIRIILYRRLLSIVFMAECMLLLLL